MRGKGVGENQDFIKVDKTKWEITKDPVHYPVEGLGSVLEAKKEAEKLKGPKGVMMTVFGILAGLMEI